MAKDGGGAVPAVRVGKVAHEGSGGPGHDQLNSSILREVARVPPPAHDRQHDQRQGQHHAARHPPDL